jgi:hypothetical protein
MLSSVNACVFFVEEGLERETPAILAAMRGDVVIRIVSRRMIPKPKRLIDIEAALTTIDHYV